MKTFNIKTSRLVIGCIYAFALIGSQTIFAQMPPFPGGGGGGNTNSPNPASTNPEPMIFGLKLQVAVVSQTNLLIKLVEGDPAGKYDVYFATNFLTGAWTNLVQGTNGQTDFITAKPQHPEGYFKATRADTPIGNASLMVANLTNTYVLTNALTATIDGGVAASMAIVVNGTNLSGARWLPFTATPIIHLGSFADGRYTIWIGVKGTNGVEFWTMVWVVRDSVPPRVTITSPTNSTTSRPMIQIQGLSVEPLSRISFDITNAAGILTNRQGHIVGQYYDTNLLVFTTNYFECLDVELTNGLNTITLRATDVAGNECVTNYNFTLTPIGDSNAPAIAILWPPSGYRIGGSNLTIHGYMDDPTATILAKLISSDGETNTTKALVERHGVFWFENMPLNPGTNNITLIATDFSGNTSLTNLILIPSEVTIEIYPAATSELWLPTTTISGTVSDNSYAVFVNGIEAIVDGSGAWSASDVPINAGGTAYFAVVATPPSQSTNSSPAVQLKPQVKDMEIRVVSMQGAYSNGPDNANCKWQWLYGKGGFWRYEVPEFTSGYIEWTNRSGGYEVWQGVRPTGTLLLSGSHQFQEFFWERGSIGSANGIITSDVEVHLLTGGKAKSKVRRLYLFTGNAIGYRDTRSIEWPFDSWNNPVRLYVFQVLGGNSFYVPTNSLAVGGLGKLDNEGELFAGVEDNADIDITIQAKVPYYRFAVRAGRVAIGLVFRNSGLLTQRETNNAGYQPNIYDAVLATYTGTTVLGAGNPPYDNPNGNKSLFNFEEMDATISMTKAIFNTGWKWHRDVSSKHYAYIQVPGTSSDLLIPTSTKSFSGEPGETGGNEPQDSADNLIDTNRLILYTDSPGFQFPNNNPPYPNHNLILANRLYAREWVTWNGIVASDIVRWRSFLTFKRLAGSTNWQRVGANLIALTPENDPEKPSFTKEEGQQLMNQ
jgi:hypothetical protein